MCKKITALILIVAIIICCFAVTENRSFLNDFRTGNIYSNISKNESYKIGNVKYFGAKGDGFSEDTIAIQSAINNNDIVFIPAGVYMINVNTPLTLRSNQTITMDDNAVLKAMPTYSEFHSLIRIDGADNITLTGGKLVGERSEHQGTTGAWGMGILITDGANRITIRDLTICDFWGDGIYLGGSNFVKSIIIDNVISDNNRRQGLSITNAKDVSISNSVFKNTNGTNPSSGIDIEPNENETVEYIKIKNTECYSNNGSGIDLMGVTGKINNVEVSDCVIRDNDGAGIQIVGASDLNFSNSDIIENNDGMTITRDVRNVSIKNLNILNNRYRGVSIISSNQRKGIEKILIEDTIIANNSQIQAGEYDGIRIDKYDSSGYIKNIRIMKTQFIDDQKIPTQRYGMTVGYSDSINGITLEPDCIFEGNKLGDIIANPSVTVKKNYYQYYVRQYF